MSLQRYEPSTHFSRVAVCDVFDGMKPEPEGRYVLATDALKVIADLREMLAECREYLSKSNKPSVGSTHQLRPSPPRPH